MTGAAVDPPGQFSGRFAIIPAHAVDDRRLKPAALRVLVALSTYSSRGRYCYPSADTVARRLGVCRQAVSRQTGVLADLGYLEVTPRARRNGSATSNGYRLLFDTELQAVHDRLIDPLGLGEAAQQGVAERGAAQQGVAPYATSDVAPIERKLLTKKDIRLNATEAEALFSRFWKAYPSRGGVSNPRKPACELFLKIVGAGADPERIIQGAMVLAARRASEITANPKGDHARFTPQAVTWLRQERWEDELTVVEAPTGSARPFSVAEQGEFLKAHNLQSAGRDAVRAKLRELGLEARWPVRQ